MISRDADPTWASPVGDDDLEAIFADCRQARRLLVAVSGGADSMALLHLVATWHHLAGAATPKPLVATVDHGLRAGSACEAAWVRDRARMVGFDHRTLPWTGAKPKTGLQEAARSARYRLLAEAAHQGGCDTLLLAHTLEDQAETVLMRLARGSGIDGLAAMSPIAPIVPIVPEWRRDAGPLRVVRPLLGVSKARLVATLQARGMSWWDDPSNTDSRFERVRLRTAMAARDALGLSAEHLALTAHRAGRARAALERWTDELVRRHVACDQGVNGKISWSVLTEWPDDMALRVLDRLIWALGGQERPPRLSRLERVWQALTSGKQAATLGGCSIVREDGDLVVFREMRRGLSAPIPIIPGQSVTWDRRFHIQLGAGPSPASYGGEDLWVRALGVDGIRALNTTSRHLQPARPASSANVTGRCEPGMQFAWPPAGTVLARPSGRAWQSLPSVWSEGRLVAVPHLEALSSALAAQLPWQLQCDCRFAGDERLWKRTPG